MSGRQAKAARRNGEVISLEARRAEQEFASKVRAIQRANDHLRGLEFMHNVLREERLEEYRAARRDLTRKVCAVAGLVLFAILLALVFT